MVPEHPAHSHSTSESPGAAGYLALVFAWIVPGLGHLLIGQRARGIIFLLTINGLFAGGLLIGGIRAINPPEQPIWTYTQLLAGAPMIIASKLQKQAEKNFELLQDEYRSNRPEEWDTSPKKIDERKAYAKDFIAQHPLFSYHPKVQDIGSVYCGIAGMLNLLVMFDVLLRITGTTREEPAAKSKPNPSAPVAPPSPPTPPAAGGAA